MALFIDGHKLQATIDRLRAHDVTSLFVQLYNEMNVESLVDFLQDMRERKPEAYVSRHLFHQPDPSKTTADLIEGARWVITRRVLYPFVNATQLYNLSPGERASVVDAFGRRRLARLVSVALYYDRINALHNMQYTRGSDQYGMVWTTDLSRWVDKLPPGSSETINKRYAPLIAEFPEMQHLVATALPSWMSAD